MKTIMVKSNKNVNNKELINTIIKQLETVYDPEFPMVDLYTLGLFYDIQIKKRKDSNDDYIYILMTFTTPSCPLSDAIMEMVKNAIWDKIPGIEIDLEITFEPMRNIDMIKDQDLKRMFL